jgi:hypothetical protein
MKLLLAIFFIISFSFTKPALADNSEQTTRLDDQTSVAVTIYNKDLALIKDQRKITLKKGLNNLAFRGVSAKIRPETALLRSLDKNITLQVLEQNFDFDLLTPQKLLEKHVGKQIQIITINPATGKKSTKTAVLLSTNNGTVLKVGKQIFTNPSGEYIFNKLPDNLRDQPTLVTQLTSSSNKNQTVELGYLTGGLSWKADYVAELSKDDKTLDLTGWVTLTNQSGTEYNNAKLQLVAGDVNQIKQNFRKSALYSTKGEMATTANDNMAEENLFEYHLYSLGRTTSLTNNQTKQVALLSANAVPVTKQFLLQGSNYYYHNNHGQISKKMKVGVFVKFKNSKKSQLGIPIPKGIIRVYKNDSKGHAQFIGEDSIDHTPKNEMISLKLGDAFDVTSNMKQTSFKRIKHSKPYIVAYENSYEIELKNAKTEPVVVTVQEPIPGDWEINQESHAHKKLASKIAQWQITVPAESSAKLTYKVLIRH